MKREREQRDGPSPVGRPSGIVYMMLAEQWDLWSTRAFIPDSRGWDGLLWVCA